MNSFFRTDVGEADGPTNADIRPLIDSLDQESIKEQPLLREWAIERDGQLVCRKCSEARTLNIQLKAFAPLDEIRPVGVLVGFVPVDLCIVLRDETLHPQCQQIVIPIVDNTVAICAHPQRPQIEKLSERRKLSVLARVIRHEPRLRVGCQSLPRDFALGEKFQFLCLSRHLGYSVVTQSPGDSALLNCQRNADAHLNAEDVVRGPGELGILAHVPWRSM
jgi:hypothetical protein